VNEKQVIDELRSGNRRFLDRKPRERRRTPAETALGQSPFCVVLSCADSRVPVEQVFDQDIGDLFVVRVAGNVACEEAVASIEYAASQLGSGVVVVMGHTGCGAVKLACETSPQSLDALPSDSVRTLVRRLMPAVQATLEGDPVTHVDRAVSDNVELVVEALRKSPVLAELERSGSLSFVGAIYDLKTGQVEFR
jgi:carbonic anhydrase